MRLRSSSLTDTQMTDIVDKLMVRYRSAYGSELDVVAANEIERLRARLELADYIIEVIYKDCAASYDPAIILFSLGDKMARYLKEASTDREEGSE